MTLSITADPVPVRMDADGVARVGGTRVTLNTVVTAFEAGATPEEIVHRYPSLDLGDLYGVIGYYLRHRSEVEAYLGEQHREADQVRKQNESRFPRDGIRERLLARRARQDQTSRRFDSSQMRISTTTSFGACCGESATWTSSASRM